MQFLREEAYAAVCTLHDADEQRQDGERAERDHAIEKSRSRLEKALKAA